MKKLIFTLVFLSITLFTFGQLHNTGIGDMTHYRITTGDGNSSFGKEAGQNITTGSYNTFLGYRAGFFSNGNNNVFIGYQAGMNESRSNKLYISNGSSAPLIYGDFSTGNMGIGTTNATVPLTILGNGGKSVVGITQNQVGGDTTMEFTTSDGISAQATRILLRGDIPDAPIEFYRGKRGEEVMSMIIGSEGNVGIGTGTPGAKLDVAGNISAANSISVSEGTQILTLSTNAAENYVQLDVGGQNHSNNTIYLGDTGNGNLNKVLMMGSVGVGTTAPDQKLSVNGNASKTGGGSWATFSDIRTKKNISSFKDGLDVLLQMNPVRFQYNGTAGYPETGKEYVGVIAQEVRNYAPYMIETVAKKLRETDEKETDLLMYDSSALAYILVNAVKEQQKIIENPLD